MSSSNVLPEMSETEVDTPQRKSAIRNLFLIGAISGGMVGAGSFVPTAIALDLALTPPLIGPANYGQMGFLALGFGCLLGVVTSTICFKHFIGRYGVAVLQSLLTVLSVVAMRVLFGGVPWGSTLFVAAGILAFLSIGVIAMLGDRLDDFFASLLPTTPANSRVNSDHT